jgi:hypothetical protein
LKRAFVVLCFGFGALSLASSSLLTGCGGDEHPPIDEGEGLGNTSRPPDQPSFGHTTSEGDADTPEPSEAGADDQQPSAGNDGGPTVSPSSGEGGGGGPAVPTELSVEVLTPTDEDEPAEVFDDTLRASCRIVGAAPDAGTTQAVELDPASVMFELLTRDGEVLDALAGARSKEDPDVFEATFATQNLASGRLRVLCRASDASVIPKYVSAEVMTFIDHGPLVTVISPQPNSPESVLGAVAFEYQIAPDELLKNDDDAALDDLTLSLFGKEFELTERDDEPGTYRTTIDFNDPDLFKEPPTGAVQVAVEATNVRGITHTENYEFVLDGAGPNVTIVSPVVGAIIGGKVTLVISATDDISAIDWNTLVISLNDVLYPYDEAGPWSIAGDSASFTFEGSEVEGSIVQITVNVLVSDFAGNQSPGASALYRRDDKPPRISMNPPNFRVRDAGATPDNCSAPFDPLGVRAAQDGDDVEDVGTYRAMVWDETNSAPGVMAIYPSNTNRDSVDLFVRRPDAPLVINTDQDPECDDIAEEGTRFQQLTALAPGGFGVFEDGGESASPALTDLTEPCTAISTPKPGHLCEEEHSDLTIVVAHPVNASEPLIYAVSPTAGLECTGSGWELPAAGLSEYQGWVCMAVRAFDNAGNRGVSAPIAVCLDSSQIDGLPDCYENDDDKPSCTDGCTLPDEIEPAILRQ